MERCFFSWNETIYVSLPSDRHCKKTGTEPVLEHQPFAEDVFCQQYYVVLEHQPFAKDVFFQQFYVVESISTESGVFVF